MNGIKNIGNTLPGICRALNAFIKQDEDYGLLSGYCGSALFYAYYYKLTAEKKYLNKLNYIIEKTIKTLSKKKLLYSHCSGIAGIAWGIQHLVKNGFIEQDETENSFEEIDEFLFNVMKQDLNEYRYDFLHEGLGIMLYFLDKQPGAITQTYLEEAVTWLEKAMVTKDTGITWRDYSPKKIEGGNQPASYNLGLAHGVPAILSILSMIYEKGTATGRILPLVERGVKWLLSNKNRTHDNCVSLYPATVSEGDNAPGAKQSRLGWCYGDLSIAITLWNIGERLQNDYYKEEAYIIFEHTLKHRDIRNGGIVDASLCHGSMGVSHIYRRAYIATGNSFFLNGADQWLQQTLQMASWKNGLAGFKYHTPNGYENNYNLLEGITGIGLALIAALDKDTTPAWDRCLLLS
ncbi:MAG: lanthionine synthetase C family protein [Ferruginibacter sp.]